MDHMENNSCFKSQYIQPVSKKYQERIQFLIFVHYIYIFMLFVKT